MRNLTTSMVTLFTFGMLAFASVAVAEPTEAPIPEEAAPAAHEGDAHEAAGNDAHEGDAHEAAGNDAHEAAGNDAHEGDAHEAAGNDAHEGDAHKAAGNDAHEGDAHAAKGHGDAAHGDAAHGMPWFESKDKDGNETGSTIFQHIFNLFVLIAILFFFGRRAVGDALRQRALGIKTDLTEAARERDEARQRHADVEARLNRFETELDGMRDEANQSAKEDEIKLTQRAQEAAKRIRETAERNIRDEVVRAQVALRKEAVDLAVQLAEDALRGSIKGDDHRRLARQFLESLED